jgi:uncharacterized membrane protein YeaQ/YmgE (transglycosylase-associated protein family)
MEPMTAHVATVSEGGTSMEFTIVLGLGGTALLIVGAVIFGVVAQFIGEARTGFEWLVDAIAAGIGALVASEFIVGWQAAGPVWDGLAIVPALVGGFVVGLLVEVATRYLTGGRYTHGAMSA